MKRRATSQLTRDGNYEDQRTDELVDVEVSTPSQIAARKIYRAKRPPPKVIETDEVKGFKLKAPLLTKDLELLLLSKPPTVDFSALRDDVKETSPDVPRKSAGFKSAGFSDLIAGINKKENEQVEAMFLTSATPKAKSVSTFSFPSLQAALTQPPKLYRPVANFECAISVNKSDKGKGRLEFMLGSVDNKSVALVVFRNSIGSLLYQGYLSKTVSITQATDVTVEPEEETGNVEYAIMAFSMANKMQKDDLRVCVAPQKFDALQAALKKIREELSL